MNINYSNLASEKEAQINGEQISTSTNNGATSIDNGATTINVEADNSNVSSTQSRFGSFLSPAAKPAVKTIPKQGYLFWDKCRTCKEKCSVLLTDFPTFIPPRIYMSLWHKHTKVCPLIYKKICELYSHYVHFTNEDERSRNSMFFEPTPGFWDNAAYTSVFSSLKCGVYPAVFKNVRKIYPHKDSEIWHLKFDDGGNPVYSDLYYELKRLKLIHPNEDEYPKEGYVPKEAASKRCKNSHKRRKTWRKKMK